MRRFVIGIYAVYTCHMPIQKGQPMTIYVAAKDLDYIKLAKQVARINGFSMSQFVGAWARQYVEQPDNARVVKAIRDAQANRDATSEPSGGTETGERPEGL